MHVHGDSGAGKTLYALGIYRAVVAGGGRAIFVDPKHDYGSLGLTIGPEAVGRALQHYGQGAFSIVVQPSWDGDFSQIWRPLFDARRLLVVVDEAHMFRDDKDFIKFAAVCRSREINVVTTSPSPVDLHPRVRQLWDAVVCFRIGIPHYAEAIDRDYFQAGGRVAAVLPQLPNLYYLRRTIKGEFSRGVVPVPR